MIRVLTIAFFFFRHGFVLAQSLTPVDGNSNVSFKAENFGLTVNGNFKGLKGEIVFNEHDIERAQFYATVSAHSVETGIALRNKHLRKADYFDVGSFPEIQFISTRVFKSANGDWIVKGILTIKGVRKEISFPFTYSVVPGGYRFIGTFEINRLEFRIGAESFSLSDKIKVKLDVVAMRKLP
jgi:polyisoprenoid-binding protein YceI